MASFFAFNWDAARKKNVFTAWKALLELGGSCGVRGKRAVASSQPSALQWSLLFVSGRKTSLPRAGDGWSSSAFGRDAARDMNVLPTREASLTIGGTCTVRERGGS